MKERTGSRERTGSGRRNGKTFGVLGATGWLALVLWPAVVPAQAQEKENPFAARYRTVLEEGGIAVDAESLSAYLRQHHSGSDQIGRYRQLINELGDDDFFKREAATAQLSRMPVQAAGALQAAAKSGDPEIRWRAEYVLEQTGKPRNDLLYAAFIVIQNEPVPGLTADVLGTAAVCHSDYLKLAMTRALEATATKEDAELLRECLQDDDPEMREAAAAALAKAMGAEAAPDLEPLLDDADDDIRLSAAEALLAHGNSQALRTLGVLLDSGKLGVRNRSIQLLRSVLKVKLPYSGYSPAETRKPQAEAWRKAIEEHVK